jgi:hypothetical protein
LRRSRLNLFLAKKIFLAKQKKREGNTEQNFQDERMSRILFSRENAKKFLSQRLLAPLLFQER